jgi:hypothetical protein
MEAGAAVTRVNVKDVVYLRAMVVSVDDRAVWGDSLRCVPIGPDGVVDEGGGEYAIKPEHVVTAREMKDLIKRRST